MSSWSYPFPGPGNQLGEDGVVLVETALLGQGLPSLDNLKIAEMWPFSKRARLLWLAEGRVKAGDLADFLKIRRETGFKRVDDRYLVQAIARRESGFLTASAVMRIAAGAGFSTVATAGMGGIRGHAVSADLSCLINLPVLLVATAPKDSLDLGRTVDHLRRNNVKVIGYNTGVCSGFLFKGKPVILDGRFKDGPLQNKTTAPGVLLLNPLPLKSLCSDRQLLREAMAAGEVAVKNGGAYHPAVNKSLDRATGGVLSLIQMQALIGNTWLALNLNNQTEPAVNNILPNGRKIQP